LPPTFAKRLLPFAKAVQGEMTDKPAWQAGHSTLTPYFKEQAHERVNTAILPCLNGIAN